MVSPNHFVAEDLDNEPNSAPKLLLQGPEGDRAGASLDMLRGEWRRLYRCEPPRISRDLLLRGIAYRRQELKHGGLGKTTGRKLKTLAKMFRTTGRVGPDPGLALKPGCSARARMAWPHAHRHGDGGRLRIFRDELLVPHEDRQEDNGSPLVGSPLLRSRASRYKL
jgi:Protein of unknown function (DUF2924)